MPNPTDPSTPARSRGRVLVVDDEEPLLRVIARSLTNSGYVVETAGDGRRAAELLDASSFDVIVSDIDMPKMSGIELLKTVRQRDLDVPVVLITGRPDLKTAMEAVTHGALQYMAKPVAMEELEKVVLRAVRLNTMARVKREALALLNQGGAGIADRLGLQMSYTRAIESLWMAYQPIVHATTRSLFGFEALLRSEEKALPHPGAILDAAERLNRLPELGRTIRATTSAQIAASPAKTAFFVNLHARDLLDESLLSRESPLSAFADRVVLEITERASLDEIKNARARVADLRKMGFRIAIDDLGAGYAGLTSFATLEPEFVKLDMSLVRDVDHLPMKQKLVRSMTTLCKDLGIMVVAEGVETPAERDLLVELGCDLLQGYLLAKPGKAFPQFVW
jgi:EAL domain-containing protein (putative c-di-GMP-specific phosphodiesterase class I)